MSAAELCPEESGLEQVQQCIVYINYIATSKRWANCSYDIWLPVKEDGVMDIYERTTCFVAATKPLECAGSGIISIYMYITHYDPRPGSPKTLSHPYGDDVIYPQPTCRHIWQPRRFDIWEHSPVPGQINTFHFLDYRGYNIIIQCI